METMIERAEDARLAMAELKKALEEIAPAQWHWDIIEPLLHRIDAALVWPAGSADRAGVPRAVE